MPSKIMIFNFSKSQKGPGLFLDTVGPGRNTGKLRMDRQENSRSS
jgi:hypothetical protein